MKIGIPTSVVPERGNTKQPRAVIATACDDFSKTYTEIAKRFGIGRERVRRIDALVNGRTAKMRKLPPRPKVFAPSLFYWAALNHGFKPQITGKRQVVINGKACIEGRTYLNRGLNNRYLQLQRFNASPEFWAFDTPAGWLIVPNNKLRKATQIKLGGCKKPGTYSSEHGWNDLVNAWHLLEER